MLQNPNIAPSASVNRWIASILTYHFTLVHIPGIKHGPDGLLRRPQKPQDPPSVDDDDEETSVPFLTIHILEPHNPAQLPQHACFQLLDAVAPTFSDLQYAEIPCTKAALDADSKLQMIPAFLERLKRPPSYTDKAFKPSSSLRPSSSSSSCRTASYGNRIAEERTSLCCLPSVAFKS